MDFDIFLKSVDSIDKLKCKTCNNFLSYFPVHVSADNKNICGRCIQIDNQHRNEAYEAIAQIIKFPCRYEGCPETLLPKDMPSHEKACPHRTVSCLVLKRTCSWEGSFSTSLQHCQDQHSELFLKNNSFAIDWTNPQGEDLLELDQKLFIVSRRLDTTNNVVQCSICNIEDGLPLEGFTIVVRTDGNTAICNQSDTRGLVQLPLYILKHQRSAIFAYIIVKESNNELMVQEKVNEGMLSQLKCSVCSEYALPPIYHGEDQEVQCSTCVDEDTNPSRNYTLDNLACLLYYPCKYRQNGCTSVLKAEKMKKHQPFCQYGHWTCPVNEYVKCEWTGLASYVMNHLQSHHKDMVKDNFSTIAEHYTPDIFTKCYMIKFWNSLFKLVFSIDEAKQEYDEDNDEFVEVQRYFRWTVQAIGHHNDDFKYEVEIIDSNNIGRRLVARQLCQALTRHEELFDNEEKYCSFSFDQTRTLVTKNKKIEFKISVLK